MTEQGKIHVYYGDGKGKTTAAMGLAIRAAGAGKKVLIAQFMKDERTSERQILGEIPGITLCPVPKQVKFSFQMTEKERFKQLQDNERQFITIGEKQKETTYDMVILDEVLYALKNQLLSELTLEDFLEQRPDDMEVVLTGNYLPEMVEKRADYITEMKKIRHPFDKGVPARRGIEI